MDNKKNEEELQSRREFFKSAAKATLPVIGAFVLANLPMVGNAATGCANNCGAGCAYYCLGTCKGKCYTGCYGTCSSTCSGSCSGSSRR